MRSEENAEGDEDSRSEDPGAWKSRIHHFGVSIRLIG